MAETLWVLTHADGTPIETYRTREEAEAARRRVLVDEPDWEHVVTVEPFEFVEGDDAAD
jgi:hypothetical protein